jgi:hypothetical protein
MNRFTPKWRFAFFALVYLLCFSFFWAGLEIYIGYVYRRKAQWHDVATRFDPEIGWRPAYNRHKITGWGAIHTNSLGFRSPEVDPSKDHIVLFGDSVTWGYGLSDEQTVSSFLQNRLGEKETQVLNLGLSGYSIDQSYLFLKRNLPHIPNLKTAVFIICAAGEFDETISNVAYGRRKPLFRILQDRLVYSNYPIARLDIRHTFTWNYLMTFLGTRSPAMEAFLIWIANDQSLSKEEGEGVAKQLLLEIKRLVESRGARLEFLLSPAKEDLEKKSPDLLLLESFFKELRIPFLDYHAHLKNLQPDPEKIYLDDEHYTALGTKLMAEYLAAQLKAA